MSNSTNSTIVPTSPANVFSLLALSSLSATTEVVLQVSVGMILCHLAIIDGKSTKVLANLYFYAALPCLNFSNMAADISIDGLKTAWIVMIFAFLYFCIGNGLAQLTFMRRLWKHRIPDNVSHAILILCVTFNNTSSLPIVFITALCLSSGSYLIENPQAALAYALMLISLYAMVNTGFMWTYGSKTLEMAVRKDRAVRVSVTEEVPNVELIETSSVSMESIEEALQVPPPTRRQLFHKYAAMVGKKLIGITKAIITPPFIALVIGLFIGCVTPLKNFLVVNPPPVVQSIYHVSKLFGGAAFPLIMVVLGINLYTTLKSISSNIQKQRVDGGSWRQVFTWKIINYNHPAALLACIVLRLIIIPGLGIAIVVTSAYAHILNRNDAIMLLVLLVEASTPSANNLSTLCSIHDGGQDQMSEILLAMYACAPFTLGTLAGAYMFLIEHLEVADMIY
jgi:predicted permease